MAPSSKSAKLPAGIDRVEIVEVGARDGLQAESFIVPTHVKIELVDRLASAGLLNIEAASFVSPKWVPQMADGSEVMRGITRKQGVLYSGLVPNLKGLERAIESEVGEVVIFGAASEAFSQKNINCSIEESVERFVEVASVAKKAGLKLRGSISCCFGCPYQGEVPVQVVLDMVKRYADLGCDGIDLADTIGVGTALQVSDVVGKAAEVFPVDQLAGHFHDTYGQALANIFAALQAGLTTFHSSVAGLGGCPYAKGATGNVATEDVLYLMQGLGLHTGVDLSAVVAAGQFISHALGKPNGSRVGRALHAKACV